MKQILFINLISLLIISSTHINAQEISESEIEQLGGDGYREGQYPGLGRAASEIFFSDKRLTLSGYAEVANVLSGGKVRDLSSGDLELYYNNLYRIAPFIGIRISKNMFCIVELGLEYFEGNGESEYEFFPEIYFDYIFKSEISFRAGIQPLNIGYINNNDEPLLFLSVNRPETERLIIPSEWIEVGFSAYGSFLKDKLSYSLTLANGAIAKKYQSPTWIRQGAHTQFESFNKPSINAQLNYLPFHNLTTSISAYYNQSGRDQEINIDNENIKVKAPMGILAGYARWDYKGFSFIGMGTYGTLGDTYELQFLTQDYQKTPQAMGEAVYGYYFEPSFDLLSVFNTKKNSDKTGNIFILDKPSIPLFVRYERLDTHFKMDERLNTTKPIQNNLSIWMVGLNFKPNHNLAAKFNVRFRENYSAIGNSPNTETLYEIGLGLEF